MTPSSPLPPPHSLLRRSWVLGILFLIYAINLMDRQIMAVLQEAIKADLDLSNTQLALLTGFSFALFYSVMGLPIAWLSDRVSRTWIISISCGVWSAFTALSGFATHYVLLLLARMGVGIGEAGGVAPSYSLLADYFPKKNRGLAFGIMSLGIPIGVALGIALGASIAHHHGWRMAFIVAAIPGLVLALVFKLTTPEPLRGGYDEAPAQSSESAQTNLIHTVKGFAQNPALVWIFIASALASIVAQSFMHWFPSLLQRAYGMSLGELATYYTPIIGLAIMAGTFLGGYLSDRFAARTPKAYFYLPAFALLLAFPASLGFLLMPNWALTLALAFLPFALSTAWMAPVLAVLHSLTATRERATAAAFLLFLNNLIGMGFGTLIVGILADLFQPWLGDQGLRLALGLILLVLPLAGLCFLKAAQQAQLNPEHDN